MGFLRFILAFAVIVFHTGGVFLGIKIIPGYVCVELFFIISGFYMEFILSGSYKHKRDFYLSRFLRLWPLFAVVAIGYLLFESGFTWLTHKPYTVSQARVYAASNPVLYAGTLFSNVFMVGEDLLSLFYVDPSGGIHLFYANFLDGVDKAGFAWGGSLRFNGPAWSIGIEIWFYLLVPFLHRFKTQTLFILLLASGGLRMLLTHFIGVHTYFFFPTQFYLFLTGMLAFRLKDSIQLPAKWARGLYFLLIAVVAGYCYFPVSAEILRYFVPCVCSYQFNVLQITSGEVGQVYRRPVVPHLYFA